MKAMILAAGLGSRLKEETRERPKALVEIAGKPLLQHAIEKLKREGVDGVVVNVHHFAGLINEFIKNHDFGIPVAVSDESDKLLDTGGGLKKAGPFLFGNDPVVVYNVDILSNLDLQLPLQEHLRSGALATLVVRNRQTDRYLLFDEKRRMTGWINRKTGEARRVMEQEGSGETEMAFSGIHILSPEVFRLMPESECFSMISLYLDLAADHLIRGYFDESERWMDVGKPEQLLEARKTWTG